MAVPTYTKNEVSTIAGTILKTTTEYINKLQSAPNSDDLDSYYTGMKAGVQLAVKNIIKTINDLEEARK